MKVQVAREQESALTFLPTCRLFLFRRDFLGINPLPSPRVLTSEVLVNSAGNEDRTFAAPPVLFALIVLAGSVVVGVATLAIEAVAAIQRQRLRIRPRRINGGERGIRTLEASIEAASCGFWIANLAGDAIAAGAPLPILPYAE